MGKETKKPIRVLIIGHTNKMGGVETFIYNTMLFSNPSIIQYDFLIHGYDSCVFEDEILNFYNNGEHIYYIPKYKKNPLKCIYQLIKFYKKYGSKYKYIHLQTGATSEILYVFPYYLLTKAKVIVHSHNGSGNSIIGNKIFQPIVNLVAKKKLACSNVAARWLFGKKYESKVQIINNGINTDKFQFCETKRNIIRNNYNLKDKFVIGHVGRFTDQKNHDYLIDIFQEVKKYNKDAVLFLVGTGELLDEVKEKVNKLNLNDSVIFAGVSNDPSYFYSAFDIFVMPSLYEGLPIVGIEAQSSGLPCIFSKNISNQIILTDKAKLLSIDSSPKEWANAILKCDVSLKKRKKYNNIVRNAGFDIRDVTNYLEKLYLC